MYPSDGQQRAITACRLEVMPLGHDITFKSSPPDLVRFQAFLVGRIPSH